MKFKNILYITAVAAFGISACSLDKFPLDKETSDSYFKDAPQFENVSNTFYADLFKGPFFDEESDICFKTNLPMKIRGGKLRVVPSSGGGWDWGTLRDINNMLDNLGNCADESVRAEYEAVGRFFRAYFYFLKVRDFGDVPWYDHELSVKEHNELYKARDSRDYVMGKCSKTLTLPSLTSLQKRTCTKSPSGQRSLSNPVSAFSRAHGATTMAMTAPSTTEITGSLQAASAAKEFITTSPYKIYSTGKPAEDYMMLFASQVANSDEVILAKAYSYSLGLSHFATYNTFGQNQFAFNKKFVDSYLMADGTEFTANAGWETKEYYEEMTGRDRAWPRPCAARVTTALTRIPSWSAISIPAAPAIRS